MKLRVRLFDGTVTAAQLSIGVLWAILLVGVFFLWSVRGIDLLTTGVSSFFLAVAQLFGLLATFFALTQFMLMGRIWWIERAFGLDRLASFHRFNGYAAIILILLHPVLLTLHHTLEDGTSFSEAYLSIFGEHPYTVLALIAEILFVLVVISSVYIARKHLSFETWYWVHLMVYVAIILAAFHQFANGGSLVGSPIASAFWLGLYAFVALNLIIWRFFLPVYRLLKYDFRIVKVQAETPTVTSVYIKARGLSRLVILPGQFVLVRILAHGFWSQEHPFTISWIPKDNQLRLTIRAVGDYTQAIRQLQPGARVLVSGPFGRFTRDVLGGDKQLLIAGGIGITPIRSLVEQASQDGLDTVVLYANNRTSDVPLKAELDQLAATTDTLQVHYIYSDETAQKRIATGRIDGEYISRTVADFLSRDVYICGPPPMMAAIVDALKQRGLAEEQIHYEVFALHP
ncbi:MAG TPA: ferric reductase-like transmembrane domain-containing protein [Patescibacteria group bacterium]|jgi:predicted ferric reductase|nr:ferric reductase-like transmembrane domain-containing protein [Patescibacteria group bacterium]